MRTGEALSSLIDASKKGKSACSIRIRRNNFFEFLNFLLIIPIKQLRTHFSNFFLFFVNYGYLHFL